MHLLVHVPVRSCGQGVVDHAYRCSIAQENDVIPTQPPCPRDSPRLGARTPSYSFASVHRWNFRSSNDRAVAATEEEGASLQKLEPELHLRDPITSVQLDRLENSQGQGDASQELLGLERGFLRLSRRLIRPRRTAPRETATHDRRIVS